MHILSKLFQPRICLRPIYRQISFNQPVNVTRIYNQPVQILFKQQIRCNQMNIIYKSLRQSDPVKLKRKDRIPEHYQLIYRNTMHNYFLSAQILSSVLGVIALILLPFVYDVEDVVENKAEGRPAHQRNDGIIFATVLVGVCVMFQILLRKCPVRIYNIPKSNNYVFVFYGSVPFSIKKIPGRVKDLVHLGNESRVIPWLESSYSLRNYPNHIILLENYFRAPADLYIMLGVQKNDELEEDDEY